MTETAAAIPCPVPEAPSWDIDPYAPEVLVKLDDWYDGLRQRGRIVWLTRYGCWAIGHFDVVRMVFGDWRRFGSARGVGVADFAREKPWRPPSIILEVDPPDHAKTRAVMMRTMTPRALAALEAPMRAEAAALVDRLLRRDEFDVVKDFAEAFPLKVFPDAVGLGAEGREKLLVYGTMVFNAIGPDNEIRRRALAKAAEVVPWITAQCARDALTGPGLGELIYQAVDDGEIAADEARLLVRSLLSAGIDTTVAVLGAAMKYFAENPAQWDIVRNDPTQVKKGDRGGAAPVIIGARVLPHRPRRYRDRRHRDPRRRQNHVCPRRRQYRPGALARPDPLRRHPKGGRSSRLRHRSPCLRRHGGGAAGNGCCAHRPGRARRPHRGFGTRAMAAGKFLAHPRPRPHAVDRH